MKRSIAIIIANSEQNQADDVKIIKQTFFRMNMVVCILLDKTSDEIMKAFNSIKYIDPSTILDVICVIRSEFKDERTFQAKNGSLDIYDSIILSLLAVEGLEEKVKLIITTATVTKIDLGSNDADNNRPYSNGRNVTIIGSDKPDFIKTFIPRLTSGDVRNAYIECRSLISCWHVTDPNVKLSAPATEVSFDHEFI